MKGHRPPAISVLKEAGRQKLKTKILESFTTRFPPFLKTKQQKNLFALRGALCESDSRWCKP